MRLLDWLLQRSDGRGLDELSRRLRVDPDAISRMKIDYRQFNIPKRTKGLRTILAPSPELRRIQRRILQRLLNYLPTHPAATGFQRGQSIVSNALPHVGRAVVIKMDLKDFFPSIDARRIGRYFRTIGWDREASQALVRLCTHDGRLPQGAPTSPRLSNLVNFHLDVRLTRLAETMGAVYTRYADDLTFSFASDNPAKVRALIHLTNIIVREEGYEPHWRDKLNIRRRSDRQVVTGLVVNEKVQLPRQTRRWLRAVEHRVATGRRPTISEQQLLGWQALARMVQRQAHPSSEQEP